MNLLGNWIGFLPALLIGVALVTVTGLPIAWALRLRGYTLIAGSVAASLAVIAATSIFTPVIRADWGILPVIGTSLLLAIILRPLSRFWITRPVFTRNDEAKSTLWALSSTLVAAAIIGLEVVRAMQSPNNISQTFDAVFHLNAAAQILDTANASPFAMTLTSGDAAATFYPTLWHAVVALLAGITSTSVTVASNIIGLAVAAIVWPIGIIFLTKTILKPGNVHLMFVGLLATTFSAFPYLLLTWGVLYPNLLSTALIPFAIAFAYLGLQREEAAEDASRTSHWIAFLGAAGAATFAHPNALFGIAILLLPLLIAKATSIVRSADTGALKSLKLSLIVAIIAAYFPMWLFLTTGERRSYDASPIKGFASAISNAPLVDARAWFTTVLVLAGVALLILFKQHLWIIFSYALTVALYTLALGFDGSIRDFIVGPWYSDAARLASLLPIMGILLAASTVFMIIHLIEAGIDSIKSELPSARLQKLFAPFMLIAIAGLVLTGARGSSISMQTGWLAELHKGGENAQLLNSEELILLERLETKVPHGSKIAGDPWTGTSLALAIADRPVLFGHLQGNFSPESLELATSFKTQGVDACPLLSNLEIEFILDFEGERYGTGNKKAAQRFDGLRHVAGSPVLEEVDREGEAVLYRVLCD